MALTIQIVAKQWRREHPRTESPFENPSELGRDAPGSLENLRRQILSSVRKGSAITVPDWLMQSVRQSSSVGAT